MVSQWYDSTKYFTNFTCFRPTKKLFLRCGMDFWRIRTRKFAKKMRLLGSPPMPVYRHVTVLESLGAETRYSA
jgi:hypothetical protein